MTLIATLIAGMALSIDPALAHRFNVVLVIPPPNAQSSPGRQIREGFMLATKERDSHPDQESDGHLGGLDVYVTEIDGQRDVSADIGRIATQGEADIVVVFGNQATISLVGKHGDGKSFALFVPRQSPVSISGLPGFEAFVSGYKREYGKKPSSNAVRGYNAARHIDVAVRAQGGVTDKALLLQNFRKTEDGLIW